MTNRQSNFMYGYRVTFPDSREPLLSVSALQPVEFLSADQNREAIEIEVLKDGVWMKVQPPSPDDIA